MTSGGGGGGEDADEAATTIKFLLLLCVTALVRGLHIAPSRMSMKRQECGSLPPKVLVVAIDILKRKISVKNAINSVDCAHHANISNMMGIIIHRFYLYVMS